MIRTAHPARSLEFLSRLHDGELSAAERAHFESHRAHCDECRRAAAEFEEALASYRTAGTSPPPSDLAARILRRLEAANPRRRPFGVVFGIDLKWAGAFTAAIVAVILGYSIASRPERARQIRVSFATPAPAPPAVPAAPSSGQVQERKDDLEVADAEPPAKPFAKKEASGHEAPDPFERPNTAAAYAPRSVGAPQAERREPARPQEVVSADAAAAPPKVTPAGAASLSDRIASVAKASGLAATPAAIRITATALDGFGQAPAILNAGELALAAEDRGEYVVTVAADGVPIDVSRAGRAGKEEDPSLQKDAGRPLRKLRFAAGAGLRRLLIQVQ